MNNTIEVFEEIEKRYCHMEQNHQNESPHQSHSHP